MIVLKRVEDSGVYEVRYDKLTSPIIGYFEEDVDGYFYYWPENKSGCYSQELLLMLGQELEKLNKSWDDHIKSYFRDQI